MIRFIFIALFLVLYLILSCPIMLILLLVRKINAKKADIIMQRIVQCALSIVWHMAGVKLTTLGLDNMTRLSFSSGTIRASSMSS